MNNPLAGRNRLALQPVTIFWCRGAKCHSLSRRPRAQLFTTVRKTAWRRRIRAPQRHRKTEA